MNEELLFKIFFGILISLFCSAFIFLIVKRKEQNKLSLSFFIISILVSAGLIGWITWLLFFNETYYFDMKQFPIIDPKNINSCTDCEFLSIAQHCPWFDINNLEQTQEYCECKPQKSQINNFGNPKGNYKFHYPNIEPIINSCIGETTKECTDCEFIFDLPNNCITNLQEIQNTIDNDKVNNLYQNLLYSYNCGCKTTELQKNTLNNLTKNYTDISFCGDFYTGCYPEINQVVWNCNFESYCTDCQLLLSLGNECSIIKELPPIPDITIEPTFRKQIEFSQNCGCTPTIEQLEIAESVSEDCRNKIKDCIEINQCTLENLQDCIQCINNIQNCPELNKLKC